MKNLGKLPLAVLAIIVLVGAVVLAVKLISGVFAVASGALNTVLGVAVILALVVIVIWMFSYAKKKSGK